MGYRVSRKRVEDILNVCGSDDKQYRLLWTEYLHEKSSTFKYWIVEDRPKYTRLNWETGEIITCNYRTGWQYNRDITGKYISLKEAYTVARELLDEAIEESNKRTEERSKKLFDI